MFIVTHTEQKADEEKKQAAIPAGLLFPKRDEIAEAALAAGIADERIVRCTVKHYVNEPVTVCYRERQVIDNVDHALRALAIGKAVLEPTLGDKIAIRGVAAGGKIYPLETFTPKPAPKRSKKDGKPGETKPPAKSAGDAAGAGEQPAA